MMNSFLTLEIDLTKIVHNYHLVHAHTGIEVASVVKADAYGVGAIPVSQALLDAGCRKFFVALVEEGIILRKAIGPGPDIFIFNGFSLEHADSFHSYTLTPVLGTLDQIRLAKKHLKGEWVLHFDTGMHRLSLPSRDLNDVLQMINTKDVRYVMTHMSCADDPNHIVNAKQLKRFQEIIPHFPESRYSLAASGSLNLGPEYYFDLIRLGGSLYGVLEHHPGTISERFQFALHAQAAILQITNLQKGESVSYGATYTAPSNRRIATIAGGYADFTPRSLSNKGGFVAVDGHKAPILGLVCMDLMVIDVTDVPESVAQVGKWVDLIHGHMSFYEQSVLALSAPRESLIRLGHRFKRRYIT